MADPYRDEAIQVWVSDFLESAAFGAHTGLVREYAPEVLAAFLTRASETRDVAPGGGRTLGLVVKALGPRFAEATSGTVAPIERPGSKLGRNDPCPCGSGRKYKKCCLGLLD